ELKPHDCTLRTRPFHAAEAQLFEHLLPTEERIWGPPIGSGDRPAVGGRGTFLAGKFDRRAHKGAGDPLATVPGQDEEAWEKPDAFVLGADAIVQECAC